MHPFSVLTLGIFIAGYITARWDLVTRLHELAIFAWDHGVVIRTAKGAAILSIFFLLIVIPIQQIATQEANALQDYQRGNNCDEEDLFKSHVAMVCGDGVLRVFWPLDSIRSCKKGVIIGWRNSDTDLVVVTVLDDVEPRNVEHALRMGHLFRNSSHPMSRIFQLCQQDCMNVLGTTNGPMPGKFNVHDICVRTDRMKFPVVICPSPQGISVQMILYRKPSAHKMQYLSLSPIPLALGDKEQLDAANENQAYLVEKTKLHSVIRRKSTTKELMISKIIGQMNCSQELTILMLRNVHLIGIRSKRSMSISEMVVESAATVWDILVVWLLMVWTVWIWPLFTKILKTGLVCHRFVAEIVLKILEWRPRAESAALKDISATAQQVDIRLQQFCYWPVQYTKLRSRRDDWESVTDNHPDYIRFYNSLWLVANDVIIGIALGAFIVDNAEYLAFFLNRILFDWTIIGLRSMIEWLTDWPAGLKLNNELASFLADLVLWVIEYWSYLLLTIRPILPHIIYFIGFSSFAGATLPIALFSDLLDLLTLHIYAFYIASARIFHWQLTIIISLFHLFRGKKNNVLRNRIDSCDYDLDQLLLGTILFTLLAFLLPTVVVFYLTFAFTRMAIITLTAVLETALAFLNHFPLFALMLRFKDSRRLPGGIRFELRDTPFSSIKDIQFVPQTSFLTVESVPLSLRQIFDQYFQLSSRLRRHYLAPSVLLCLLTGRFVPPIDRRSLYSLQYIMLPANRPSIREIWTLLNQPNDKLLISKLPSKISIPNGAAHRTRRNGMKLS